MVSRMEKYYKNDNDIKQRSTKNRDLYRSIYDYGEYSNIEGIASMDKNNEIDITKVQKMLKNREDYKRQKQFRQISKTTVEEEKPISNEFVKKEQRNYDIRDILNKARDKKPDEDAPRSLDDESYSSLKNLQMNGLNREYTIHKDFENDELKELIDTITNTSMLNQMNDMELGLNMFDLEESETHNNDSIKQLLEQAKKYEEVKDNSNIDNSFFTSSLNFSKDDFEDSTSIKKKKKKNNKFLKFLLFITLVVFTFLVIFGVYSLIN